MMRQKALHEPRCKPWARLGAADEHFTERTKVKLGNDAPEVRQEASFDFRLLHDGDMEMVTVEVRALARILVCGIE